MRGFLLGLIWVPEVGAETIRQAFPPPAESTRVSGGSFGDYLGRLELRESDVPIRTHDGQRVYHHGRVIELPLVRGDLQQCADSAIRVHAEWQRSEGVTDISYHATSGDPLPWDRYRDGDRPYVKDGRIAWKSTGQVGAWDSWLRAVFMWAGTRSLEAYETDPVEHPIPGDVLVEGGSPGHAVLILDVAKKGDQTFLLLGEGFMPAQDFHVELGPVDGWWLWSERGLTLPHWVMDADSLRRWR